MLKAPQLVPLALVLEDLDLAPERLRVPGGTHSSPGDVLISVPSAVHDPAALREELIAFAQTHLAESGLLLALLEGPRGEGELARWRDALWPLLHVGAIYDLRQDGIVRRALSGNLRLRGATGARGSLIVARKRAHLLSPDATQAKFDQNAGGWNTAPGTPGYAHYRWMRRHVALFAGERKAARVLDFGCGAGWVGIEAALHCGARELAAFDASPEMVRHAEENARASGIASFTGRAGFGENPPFPAEGEAPFDLVVCSGVVSFSPDHARFLDGLVRALAPGGTLVFGDLQRESRGMRKRRAQRALLPIRELNACTPEELVPELERRGLRLEARRGYQLSWPMPQLMHANETRLAGALDKPLVALNRAAGALLGGSSPRAFDSWVLRFSRPG
ncbi:MAG: class I SAM-dependent methyltransferase [Planctomycetes bacterium]|nr:class I SAM-dependent methyltransferase [Planctomycetota bacterium]